MRPRPASLSGRRLALSGLAVLVYPAEALAQRERESLGVAAERDGGEDRIDGILDLGGEVRQRVEVQDRSPTSADSRRGDALVYHRLLADADLRVGAVRGYAQLGAWRETGRNGPPVPVSTNRLDVQQAFVDLTIGSRDRRVRVRGGRQELSFEFVAVQNSPNVRRTWDGARATLMVDGWELDTFSLGRVRPQLGSLDDTSSASDRLDGLHLISPAKVLGGFYLSAFYYDTRQLGVAILPNPAPARTRTFGGVIDGTIGSLTLRVGGGRQTGRFGARRVDAHSYEAVVGLRFPATAWSPNVALRTDGFSGGASTSERVRTWNPLFPNFAYSVDAAFQTPSNLRRVGAIATANPSKKLELSYRGEGLWRYSADDALYLPAGFELIPPDGSRRRWIGFQQQLSLDWRPREGITVSAAYVNLQAGRFLVDAGRTGQNFGTVSTEWRF